MLTNTKLTSRQYLMLGPDPPGVRLELVHGEIYVGPRPSYSHSFTDAQLACLIGNYIAENDLGELVGDVDTIFDEDDVRRPDIIFVSKMRTRLRDPGKHGIWFPPDLCVEIISPDSEEYDQKDKFDLYEESGVAHYWIVDPTERTFLAYKLGRKGYVKNASGRNGQSVKAEPFTALAIPLNRLWIRKRR
jgi:Uma2 family endonuclease